MKKRRLSTSASQPEADIIHLAQSPKPQKVVRDRIAFRYKCYSELLQKRSALHEEIKKSLMPRTQVFTFNNWWRLTTSKYSIDPINASGSCKNPNGGRFNIGQIDTTNTGKFSKFPSLYLAETKEIAVREVYPKIQTSSTQLSSMERMLSSNEADAFFKVSGQVCILDIDKPNNLTSFVKVIKKITFDSKAKKKSIKLDPNPQTVQTVAELKKALYLTDWKNSISMYDDPSPSQIFGQIVKSCGIEGLLYSSVQSRNKHGGKCLALFLENFEESDSFVEVVDTNISKKKIDRDTFKEFF